MRVFSNWNAANILSQMSKQDNVISQTIERLSSGKRLNRAADDPSGAARSTGLKSQISGVDAAIQNAEQASSLLATMDDSMSLINNVLLQVRDLVLRVANEAVMTTSMRGTIQSQIDDYLAEITDIAEATDFNDKDLLIGRDKVIYEKNPGAIYRLYSMNVEGTSENLLYQTSPVLQNAVNARVSPDGTKIAYYNTATTQIYVGDVDAGNLNAVTNVRQVTTAAGAKTRFSWSPDGTKLLYVQSSAVPPPAGPGSSINMRITSIDGSNDYSITVDGTAPATNFYNYPEWSPDGTKILYTRNNDVQIAYLDYDSATDKFSITSQVDITGAAPALPGNHINARWSGDGSQVVYQNNSTGVYEIYTMTYDADPITMRSSRQQITTNGVLSQTPTYTADGERIVYNFNNIDIYSVKTNGTDNKVIANTPQNERSPSAGSLQYTQSFRTAVENTLELSLTFQNMRARGLGVGGVNVSTSSYATAALEQLDAAIDKIDGLRMKIGVTQLTLGTVIDDLESQKIYYTAANANIEDADIAQEITQLTKAQLIQQAAITALTHSNNRLGKIVDLMEESTSGETNVTSLLA